MHATPTPLTHSEYITNRITELGDWRGERLAQLRQLIHQADPHITEEWKWETPTYTHNGLVCATGSFKDHVKINFFKGAALSDPDQLINNGLDSKKHRSIDFYQGDSINEPALLELIRAAVALNLP